MYRKARTSLISPGLAAAVLMLPAQVFSADPEQPGPGDPPLVQSRAAVGFSSLEGPIVINRDFVGPLESMKLIATDGRELDPEAVGAAVSERNSAYELDPGDGQPARIVIEGKHGVVDLVRAQPVHDGPDPDRVLIADGLLDCMNGQVQETLRLPNRFTELERSPADHRIQIDGADVVPVAMREGEIAIAADDMPLPAAGGTSLVRIVTPSAEELESTVPAWGFALKVPHVTLRRAPVDVSLQVVGLQAHEALRFEFVPEPGQRIDPQSVTVTGDEAATPIIAARLQSSEPGPQALNYRLRPADPPDPGG